MKLVCIKKGKIKNLTEGCFYTIVRENKGVHLDPNMPYQGVWIVNDAGIEKHYSIKRFVSIENWRNIRLNELGI